VVECKDNVKNLQKMNIVLVEMVQTHQGGLDKCW